MGDRMSAGQRPHALVIDDEEVSREILSQMLASMGCEVTCASGAKEALAAFLKVRFDLVTLDHRMPGLCGMDIHKVLSQEFAPRKLPPILIVTGYAEDPEVVRGQSGEGIVGVLRKPVDKQALRSVVQDALGPVILGQGPDPGQG